MEAMTWVHLKTFNNGVGRTSDKPPRSYRNLPSKNIAQEICWTNRTIPPWFWTSFPSTVMRWYSATSSEIRKSRRRSKSWIKCKCKKNDTCMSGEKNGNWCKFGRGRPGAAFHIIIKERDLWVRGQIALFLCKAIVQGCASSSMSS